GSLLATFMFTVWGADSSFVVDWGWRIPFWLALPLGYITHYIRTHLEDSPVYAQMQERMKEMGEKVEHPIRTLFTKHLRVLLISFGACVLNAVGFYAVLTYLPNYLETTLNYPPSDASTITTIVLVVYIAFIFLSGRIADKVGRKKTIVASMLIWGVAGFALVFSPNVYYLFAMRFVLG
ncbi:MFS transporter, partial [Eggerthella lenta]